MGHFYKTDRLSFLHCGLLLLIVIALLATPLSAHAQSTTTPLPSIRIPTIDTSQFPEVAVQLYGENLSGDLSGLTVEVAEDGAPVLLSDDRTEKGIAGTQTAIVFDAAGNVTKNGPTGEPIYIEVGKTLRKLIPLGVLSSERDFLTTISFGTNQEPVVLHEWSQDHQAVVDSVYQYKPIEGIGNTSIHKILRFTLDQLADPTLPEGQVKSIVLLSDGVDIIKINDLFDAVNLAKSRNIHIHTILIGQDSVGPRTKMQDLAKETGGQFVHLSSIDALESFWPIIAQGGTRRILRYRSQQAKPGKISVTVTLPDGKKIAVDGDMVVPALAPATVTVVTPLAGSVVDRRGPQFDTKTQQLTPRRLPVQAIVEFPDSRKIRSLEYTIVKTEEVLQNFDQPYEMDISDLGAGNYTVRARVVDELGIESISQPVEFTVRVALPPAPTATPDPKATENAIKAVENAKKATQAAADKQQAEAVAAAAQAEAQEAQWWQRILTYLSGGTAIFGLAMLGLALYFFFNPRIRKAATQVITGTVAAVTQPFMPARRRGAKGGGDQARATLRLIEDGGISDAPQSIPLTRTGISIGRDPNVVNIVLSDRHISKLHCRIVEDANSGGYRLLDEGSTSGTYIDDKEVDINGTVLKHGDLIAIGPVQYQFEMTGQAPRRPRNDDPDTQSNIYDQDDSTEPYLRAPGKSKTEPVEPRRDK